MQVTYAISAVGQRRLEACFDFDEDNRGTYRARHWPFFGRASPSPNLQEVLICKGCPHTAAEIGKGLKFLLLVSGTV